jgi:pyruvate/2-oxoglutarate dehydrogenase complex dihydrolipoamide dehydrogenase (E3) component
MYSRFGTQVTLLGRNRQLAPGEDGELADLLADYLREEGISVHTNAPVIEVKTKGAGKIITALIDGVETDFHAETILLAAGRVANTDKLNLQAAGIGLNERDFITVDKQLRTGQSHIWAIGDVKGG